MSATILDGKATASAVKAELATRVERLKARGITPGLATVLVGDDPGSHAYVAGKHRDCAEIGMSSIRVDMPATSTQEEVEAAVLDLNADPAVTGYIVQLPLPRGLDGNRVLGLIDPAKDADGLHPENLGKLVLGVDAPLPCTPLGNPGCHSPVDPHHLHDLLHRQLERVRIVAVDQFGLVGGKPWNVTRAHRAPFTDTEPVDGPPEQIAFIGELLVLCQRPACRDQRGLVSQADLLIDETLQRLLGREQTSR